MLLPLQDPGGHCASPADAPPRTSSDPLDHHHLPPAPARLRAMWVRIGLRGWRWWCPDCLVGKAQRAGSWGWLATGSPAWSLCAGPQGQAGSRPQAKPNQRTGEPQMWSPRQAVRKSCEDTPFFQHLPSAAWVRHQGGSRKHLPSPRYWDTTVGPWGPQWERGEAGGN